VLDALLVSEAEPPHDLLITHVGGKARFASVVRALRAVDVPAAVIADLDVLREEALARNLVEALGGDWNDFVGDWRVVNAAVEGLARNPHIAYVRDHVTAVLDNAESASLTPAEADRIRETVRVEDGWTQVKRGGIGAIPQGDGHESCNRLIARLNRIGLFVVDVGELERWEAGVPGRSSAWVNAVLERELHAADDAVARPFVRTVSAFFVTPAA
jgi:hypothetical protein